MKKFLSLGLSVLLALSNISCYAAGTKTDATYETVFAKDHIMNINIEIANADLQDMYDYAINEEYHSADITIDGVKVENVGIRTKGNMTLSSVANSDSDRYSFRIKFNKYVKGQTYLGLDELCLNNGYSDASYMREYLHYEILEELGMNVPRRAYCNVYINGELSGFYLAVEAIDDTFMEREFGADYEEGNLYKMDMGSTLEYKENEEYTYVDHKSGTDEELTEFKSFVQKLNAITAENKDTVDDFLNVKSALKYIAANTVLCNYDSYNGNNHHNFYLYQDKNGQFTVIPWDFNMSFGGFNGSNATVGIDTPFISGSLETLPLIGKLLSIDEYKEEYYGYIKEIMALLETFEERVTELKTLIQPYVEADPTAFYSVEDFEKATTLQKTEQREAELPKESAFQGQAPDKMTAQEPQNRGHDRGGQPFGGTDSIVNCVADRLENLKEQFNGTAQKVTESENSHGGGQGRDPGGDFTPPEAEKREEMPENGKLPENREDFRQPGERPDFSSEQIAHPEAGDAAKEFPFEGQKGDRKNATAIRVHVNGHIIQFDTAPVLQNDTTLVGFRGILEALGATVLWEEETQTVTAVKEDTTVVLTIGSDTAYVNDTAYSLLAAPVILEDSTMVPIRFISERLGMKVTWNEETKLITVLSK